jgi:hypothetical protein
VPETTKVTKQLDEMDRRLIMRNSKDIFLHGDQHDLKDMVKRLKHNFLTESRDRIHRMLGETIEKPFKRCFDALKKQTVQVVQKKYLHVGDQHNRFQNFGLVGKEHFQKF